jgi:hypothetical protein
MDKTFQGHTFHIPVMGTGFSIDTPIKVAKYGISSVISLVDDTLIEQIRGYYCQKENFPYTPITRQDEDHRARRITEYLNLIDRIVKRDFEVLKRSPFESGSEITKYFELLPEHSTQKQKYRQMLGTKDPAKKHALQENLRSEIRPGSIDVNIMTKLDRSHFDANGTELPPEQSDAMAALRGYAKSTLESAIVLSAGINRKLYSYFEKFEDFYANASGSMKKKIILKVSDYRSSLTQGKFFAKKGLWISEYRVESGLNCGGHAFPTNGNLMGPILEEFKQKKQELITTLHEMYNKARAACGRSAFDAPHPIRFTAQGGVGTREEHEFLLSHHDLDSIGWATPFLLVPEVTNVDEETLKRLAAANEEDLYLSDSSPLGVPFNNLRSSLSEEEKRRRTETGCSGAVCMKGHLVSNTEFSNQPICVASRLFQKQKLNQINGSDHHTESEKKVIAKACICHELGVGVLKKYDLIDPANAFPAICPGPNLAYFSKIMTLREMADHIYGRINLLNEKFRPHMFLKELKMYVDVFIADVKKAKKDATEQKLQELREFRQNLLDGIDYYRSLFPTIFEETSAAGENALKELEAFKANIESKYLPVSPISA